MLEYSKPVVVILALSIIHFICYQYFVPNFSASTFISGYVSQIVLSVFILFALMQVEKKAKEQLGYVFLGLTSAKVIISYLIAKQFLFQGAIIEKEIKINFFIAFMFLLCLDAYFVIRFLNKK